MAPDPSSPPPEIILEPGEYRVIGRRLPEKGFRWKFRNEPGYAFWVVVVFFLFLVFILFLVTMGAVWFLSGMPGREPVLAGLTLLVAIYALRKPIVNLLERTADERIRQATGTVLAIAFFIFFGWILWAARSDIWAAIRTQRFWLGIGVVLALAIARGLWGRLRGR